MACRLPSRRAAVQTNGATASFFLSFSTKGLAASGAISFASRPRPVRTWLSDIVPPVALAKSRTPPPSAQRRAARLHGGRASCPVRPGQAAAWREHGTHRGIASQWLGRERHNTTSAQAEATCSLPRDTGRVARRRSLAVGQTAGTNRRQPTKPAAPTR